MSEKHSEEAEEPARLTPEQIAEIKAIQKRRMIIAAIAGIILLVLGFFAGQSAQHHRNSGSAEYSIAVPAELAGFTSNDRTVTITALDLAGLPAIDLVKA